MTRMVSQSAAASVLPELAQVLHTFFHAMDTRDYGTMLALFPEHGRWLRQGQWLEGREAIRGALEARPADTETRHVISNVFVSRIDPSGTIEVEAYMTGYRYPHVEHGELPMVRGAFRFNLVTTHFRRDWGGEWRIAEQRMVPAFGFSE